MYRKSSGEIISSLAGGSIIGLILCIASQVLSVRMGISWYNAVVALFLILVASLITGLTSWCNKHYTQLGLGRLNVATHILAIIFCLVAFDFLLFESTGQVEFKLIFAILVSINALAVYFTVKSL